MAELGDHGVGDSLTGPPLAGTVGGSAPSVANRTPILAEITPARTSGRTLQTIATRLCYLIPPVACSSRRDKWTYHQQSSRPALRSASSATYRPPPYGPAMRHSRVGPTSR